MRFFKKLFTKQEGYAFLICVLMISFGFGFDDGATTFVLLNWIKNFFMVILLVAVSLFFHIFLQKYFAYRHDCTLEFKLWFIKRFGFRKWQRADRENPNARGIPMGLMLSFFFTIMSNGKLPFTAVGISDVTVNRTARSGRKTIDLGNYEEALIQIAGPMANIALLIIGLYLGKLFGFDASKFVMINFFMALFCMLPFSSLEGAKIFFGSRNLYVFGLIMIILAFVLKGTGIFGATILTILLSFLLTGAYYYKWENA